MRIFLFFLSVTYCFGAHSHSLDGVLSFKDYLYSRPELDLQTLEKHQCDGVTTHFGEYQKCRMFITYCHDELVAGEPFCKLKRAILSENSALPLFLTGFIKEKDVTSENIARMLKSDRPQLYMGDYINVQFADYEDDKDNYMPYTKGTIAKGISGTTVIDPLNGVDCISQEDKDGFVLSSYNNSFDFELFRSNGQFYRSYRIDRCPSANPNCFNSWGHINYSYIKNSSVIDGSNGESWLAKTELLANLFKQKFGAANYNSLSEETSTIVIQLDQNLPLFQLPYRVADTTNATLSWSSTRLSKDSSIQTLTGNVRLSCFRTVVRTE